MARLSLPNTVPIGPWPARLEKWLGPFSNTTTCHPAWASAIAANDPPAPLPITIALRTAPAPRLNDAQELQHLGHDRRLVHRVGPVGTRGLLGRVPPGLDVARVADVLPPDQIPVAAVLRHRVQALDRVLEQQRPERPDVHPGQYLVLVRAGGLGEVPAREPVQGRDPVPVLLLPAGQAPAPGDRPDRIERDERRHEVGT